MAGDEVSKAQFLVQAARRRQTGSFIIVALFVSSLALGACGTATHAAPQNHSITGAQAWNYVGQTKTVRYYVAYTGSSSAGTEFLDQKVHYTNGFITTIFASGVANFPTEPAQAYYGHTIDVTGTISIHSNYVEIIASSPSQIQIVS